MMNKANFEKIGTIHAWRAPACERQIATSKTPVDSSDNEKHWANRTVLKQLIYM